MKVFILLVVFWIVPLYCQEQVVDVIYLKNGSVLKGVTEEKGGKVYITIDKGRIILKKSDIERIEKEAMVVKPRPVSIPVPSSSSTRTKRNWRDFQYQNLPYKTLIGFILIGLFYGLALFCAAKMLDVQRSFLVAFIAAILNFLLHGFIFVVLPNFLQPSMLSADAQLVAMVSCIIVFSTILIKILYDISFPRAFGVYITSILVSFFLVVGIDWITGIFAIYSW